MTRASRLRALATSVLIVPLLVATGEARGWPSDPAPSAKPADQSERPVKQIKLYVEKWKWTPDTIRVSKGTHLVLIIESFDGTREFELKDYGLKVPLPRGETVRVEFDADRAGTFRWRCSRPCGDGCAKLRGKLIVVE